MREAQWLCSKFALDWMISAEVYSLILGIFYQGFLIGEDENYKVWKEHSSTINDPTELLNAIYHYHLQALGILERKTCLHQWKRELDQNIVRKQYFVQYEPLVVERWALPTIKVKGFKSITDLPRCCIEDTSHEVCCDPQTKEEQLAPMTDVYQCDTCHRTYHWQCLLDL